MVRKQICMLIVMLCLFSGCAGPSMEETLPTEIRETLPMMQVMETIGEMDDYPGLENRPTVYDEEVWMPAIEENGQLQLRCLLKNDGPQEQSIESAYVEFFYDTEQIGTRTFPAEALPDCMPPADAGLTLTLGDSALLKLPVEDRNFDEAICTVTLRDVRGEASEQLFRFTTWSNKMTPLPMNYEGGWAPVVQRNGGWVFFSTLHNETDQTCYLEAVHHSQYMDGVPVSTITLSPEALTPSSQNALLQIAPGDMTNETDGIQTKFCNFNQRETTYVYRTEDGEPVLQTFRFRLSEEFAIAETVPGSGVYVLDDFTRIPEELGAAQYSVDQIRKMVLDGLPLETIAEKITNVADLIQYLHESRYGLGSGDVAFESGGVEWHVNQSADVTFSVNRGNSGGGSNLVNYILRGDYEEQGYVHEVTYRGGHIYNYFRVGETYYFLDLTQSMSDNIYNLFHFRMITAESLEAYADHAVSQNHQLYGPADDYYTVMFYSYPYDGNHRPLGLQETFTILTSEIEEEVTLSYLEEGYAPEFAKMPPEDAWPKNTQ